MIYRFLLICFVLISCQSPESEKQEQKEPTVEKYESFYPNGLKQLEGKLVNGERHGKWIAYHENGMKWSEGSYRNGVREGNAIIYYENGKKKIEGRYKKGYKVGIWRVWEDDGTFADSLDTGKLLSRKDSLVLELIK